MSYLSLPFSVFVLALCALYYVAQTKKLGWIVLLLGSVCFYCSFDLKYSIFLGATAVTTYVSARSLPKVNNKKLLFSACAILNIGVWFVIKALPWTVKVSSNLLALVGYNVDWSFAPLIVPIGISYFTLQAIGYLVDVYSGKILPERNFAKYLLFLSYFPAVVQGPISRYNELLPQLINTKPYCFEHARKSMILILIGLVKKMVIADRLALFVNACFADYEVLTGAILYLGAVGYAIQLYMDFSGCVDICRGVSSLFNVDLPNNFNRPYWATSIKEFWSKWHMSLSRWLKDYIYIPLGGNRKGSIRKYLNLLITFLVSGLWHGAGFSFFLWGALHAIYQIVGQITVSVRSKLRTQLGIASGSLSERIYQIAITFHLVTFAWIFFRAPGLIEGIQYIKQMLCEINLYALTGTLFEMGVNRMQFLVIVIHLCIIAIAEVCSKSQESLVNGIAAQHVVIRWSVLYILIMDIFLFGAYGSGYDLSGFLYGGF